MKIQLDSSALAALFPEGSEARVQLTVADMVDPKVKEQFKGLVREVLKGI